MACEHPNTFVNRTRSFLLGLDKPMFTSPCGKCEGCRKDMQNQWWLRVRQEVIDCYDKGGRVFFPTFTYSERCMPKHYYRNGDGRVDYFPCFNHQDKNRYLNSFRKQFEREGITKGFKYFWVSEYGEINTKRGHYHALLFFDASYNRYSDEEIIQRIKDHWAFGIVGANKELGMKVNPYLITQNSSYVSKYTTKSLEFFDQPKVKAFIECKGMIGLKAVKDKLPKKFCSKGIGKGLVDFIKDSDDPKKFFLEGIQILMDEGSKNINIPRYIYDKLMFRYDKETGFKEMTEFGQNISQQIFEPQIRESASNLRMQSLAINIRSKVSDKDIEQFIPIGYDKDINTLAKLINHYMNGRTFEQLAIYKKVFKGMTILDDSDYIFLEDVFNDEKKFMRYANRINNEKCRISISDRLSQDWTDEPMLKKDSYLCELNSASYNNHHCFKGFDHILDILEYIQKLASMRRLKVRLDEEKKLREVKAELKQQAFNIKTLSRTQQIFKFYKR